MNRRLIGAALYHQAQAAYFAKTGRELRDAGHVSMATEYQRIAAEQYLRARSALYFAVYGDD